MARLFVADTNIIDFGTGISKLSVAEYTILAWGFPDGVLSEGRITNRGLLSTAGHMQLTEINTDGLRVRQTFSSTAALAISQDNFILQNQWALYVGLIDSSKVPRLFRSKPDESVMVEATYGTQTTGSGSLLAQESQVFTIGNTSNVNKDWVGRLANISIYDRELSQNEMLAVKAGVQLEGLIFFAPLWGLASPEPDLSPNPEQGTVVGATQVDHAPVGFYAVSA